MPGEPHCPGGTRQLAGLCHSWCLLLVLQRLKRELSSCAIDKTKGDTEADRYRQQLSVVCMYVCMYHVNLCAIAYIRICMYVRVICICALTCGLLACTLGCVRAYTCTYTCAITYVCMYYVYVRSYAGIECYCENAADITDIQQWCCVSAF